MNSISVLTIKQQRILDFIQDQQRVSGETPSRREIARHFGFASPNAVNSHLDLMKKKGVLSVDKGKARSLRIASPLIQPRGSICEIPLYGSIPAGVADLREQEAEGCVSVDPGSIGFKPGRNTFALRVKGDSMTGKHICDGDIVILEFNAEPRHGQTVAALVDGHSTLKTYLLKAGRPFLRAANPKYKDIIPAEELVIQGVLRGIIRHIPAS